MIQDREGILKTWQEFQGLGIKRPKSEAEYDDLNQFLNELTDHYNCNQEPYASLFDLVAGYMHEWELEHYPELKNIDVPPHEMLASLMEQHGVSQYQLAQEGIAHQSTLSKILSGERKISKEIAKQLARRFKVSVEVFL